MKRLVAICLLALAVSLPAFADHLDGVVPLVRDDIAAIAQVKAQPGRHVMLYFGDHMN